MKNLFMYGIILQKAGNKKLVMLWGSPYEYLPLHLCSLTALVLPVVLIILVYLGFVYWKQIMACFRKKEAV